MAPSLNFRSAISGFNREDVVHYIEFMNSKYTNQINQLTSEAEELHRKLAQVFSGPDLSGEVAELTAQKEQLEQDNAQLQARLDAALAELEALKNQQPDPSAQELAAQELEAYRRAEQAERAAKQRAEQIYQQATGTLAQATAQVDDAACNFRQIAEQVSAQMQLLQSAIDGSKNALLDAATTMYSIRPEDAE